VRLWDARTGQALLTLQGHTGEVIGVTFSPDGQRIIGRSDETILAWEATTGAQVRAPSEIPALADSAALHPSRPLMAVAQGNLIQLIDLSPPNEVELGLRLGKARFDPSWHITKATRHEVAGNWFAAAFHWGQVVEHDPDSVTGWRELEEVCLHLGDAALALAVCERCLQQDPRRAPVYFCRARLRGQRLDFRAATVDHLAGLTCAAANPIGWPDFAKVESKLAAGFAEKGDWPQACQAFARAALFERQEIWHQQRLAWTKLATGQEDAFRATCRLLYEHYGDTKDVEQIYRLSAELGLGLDAGPSLLRGLARPATGAILEGLQARRKAVIVYTACLCPNHGLPAAELVKLARPDVRHVRDWSSLEKLGAALYRAHQFDEAIATLEEAIRVHGRGGTSWMKLFLAMAYQHQGQPDKAREWLDTAATEDAGWQAQLIYDRLHKEATELIKPER
jgi:tetratricopeptide (TPR) repeat protein